MYSETNYNKNAYKNVNPFYYLCNVGIVGTAIILIGSKKANKCNMHGNDAQILTK